MLKIAVCDDDEMICTQLERMLEHYSMENNVKFIVDLYNTAESLIKGIKLIGRYDLIFLDIEMKGITGIEFGKNLREGQKDELTKIVFISHEIGYAKDLFRIRPLDFLSKPLNVEGVFYNIDKCIELLGIQKQHFVYSCNHEKQNIPINEIIYFESSNRIIIMHTIHGEVNFYEKLEDLNKRVEEKFFWRIHKSYLINLMYARKFTHKGVLMINDTKLPISQSYKENIRMLQKDIMRKEKG